MSKWLFIEKDNHARDLLAGAKIPVAELEITEPKKSKGLVFPEKNKYQVMNILKIEKLSEEKTNLPEIFFTEETPFEVKKHGEHLEGWKYLQPVFLEYAKKLKVDIEVRNPHQRVQYPQTKEGKLFVNFYSSPESDEMMKYKEVFSCHLSEGQADGVVPSFNGTVIIDDKRRVVAEIIEGTLYILFDLPHTHSSSGDDANYTIILSKIMEQYALFKNDPTEYSKKLSEGSRRSYVEECGRRIASDINNARQSIDRSKKEIADFQKGIVRAVRTRDNSEKELKRLLSDGKERNEEFSKEFDNLLSISGVREVSVTEGIIHVFTDVIIIQHNKYPYEIGKFRIDVYTEMGNIEAHNLTRKVGCYDHPHICDGECCFGNIEEGLSKLIGGYQYVILIETILRFLRSVNPSGWHQDISNWS